MNDQPISRRAFSKAAVVTAAAAVPAISYALSPRAYAAGSDRLKLGLVGCGGRGTGAAAQALTADSGAVLWSMGDMFRDRLDSSIEGLRGELGEDAATRLEVPSERQFLGFDAYRQVVDSGVDVVLLASYPHFRADHVEYAVAAKKHVFTEKPMGVDAPGIVRVRDASRRAREQGTAMMSGFCWRRNDGMRACFQKLTEGAIGDIVSAHTNYHTGTLSRHPRQPGWSDMEFQMRNWWHFTWLSGDHIVEQAIHSIDRLAWAMNGAMPVRCVGLGGRAAREGPESGYVYDHFTVIYEYDDGRRAFHTCRQIDNCPSDNTDYVYGTKGSAVVNGWKPTYELKDRAGATIWAGKFGPETASTMYQNEHDELFASIRAGKPVNDGEWMCDSCMLAIMGRMAAYTGQTISWEQAWASRETLEPTKYAMGDVAVPPVPVPGRTKFS